MSDQILGKEEKILNFHATIIISVVSGKDTRNRVHTTQDQLSELLENHIRWDFCSYLSLLVAHNSCNTYELERFESASDRFVKGIGYLMRGSVKMGFFVQPAKTGTVTWEQLVAMFCPLNEL